MEEVINIKNKKSVEETRVLLNDHLHELKTINKKEWSGVWGIKTSWNKKKDRLYIESKTFKVNGYFELLEGKLLGYVQVPFYFLPFKASYVKMLRKIVKDALC